MILANIPAPIWDGIELGPVKIHAYALCIILGAIFAFWYGSRRWSRRDGAEGAVYDIGIWAVLFGIVGARLYHVISVPDVYFGPNYDGTGDLIKVFYIWEGGIAITGAILGGALGAWIACRRYGYKLSAFADTVAPGLLIAQAVGRLGNYFNQELFGSPTTLPWGLQVDPSHYNFPAGLPADTVFHPTFLYEGLWNVLGFVVLIIIDRKLQLRRGMMMWCYVAWYTTGRIFMETLRIDQAQVIEIAGLGLRWNMWSSIILLLIALVMLVYLSLSRPQTATEKAEAETVWLPGRKPDSAIAESVTESDVTMSDTEARRTS